MAEANTSKQSNKHQSGGGLRKLLRCCAAPEEPASRTRARDFTSLSIDRCACTKPVSVLTTCLCKVFIRLNRQATVCTSGSKDLSVNLSNHVPKQQVLDQY